ncbi:hypothetical protein DIPPA_13207 [Diplonema papillatum]|nr:hypothetical protein DIPPA_13207 [Diplonema papillatum]
MPMNDSDVVGHTLSPLMQLPSPCCAASLSNALIMQRRTFPRSLTPFGAFPCSGMLRPEKSSKSIASSSIDACPFSVHCMSDSHATNA